MKWYRNPLLCFMLSVLSFLCSFSLLLGSVQRPANRFDVLIRNGRIVDGTGAPWFRADIGVSGDRIVAIGTLPGASATTTIDATNLVVSPGFIDLLGQSEFNVLVDG